MSAQDNLSPDQFPVYNPFDLNSLLDNMDSSKKIYGNEPVAPYQGGKARRYNEEETIPREDVSPAAHRL